MICLLTNVNLLNQTSFNKQFIIIMLNLMLIYKTQFADYKFA